MKNLKIIAMAIAAVVILSAVVGFLFNPLFIWIAAIAAIVGIASIAFSYMKSK